MAYVKQINNAKENFFGFDLGEQEPIKLDAGMKKKRMLKVTRNGGE